MIYLRTLRDDPTSVVPAWLIAREDYSAGVVLTPGQLRGVLAWAASNGVDELCTVTVLPGLDDDTGHHLRATTGRGRQREVVVYDDRHVDLGTPADQGVERMRRDRMRSTPTSGLTNPDHPGVP